MADNSSLKAKLNSLDDMQLYNLINSVALAAGMDAKKTKALTGDIPRLRKMLSTLDEKQISTLLSMVGNGTVNDLLSRF